MTFGAGISSLASRTTRKAALVFAVAAWSIVLGVGGCGSGRYPVSGRVTYDDGSPVTEGTVIGQMGEGPKSVSVQGRIDSSGRFSWGTERPADGAEPGKYLVAVTPRGLSDEEIAKGVPPAVDPKFSNLQTSGIEFDVKPGTNQLNIKVSKPKRPRQ